MKLIDQYYEVCWKIGEKFWQKYIKNKGDKFEDYIRYEGPGKYPNEIWCFGDLVFEFNQMFTALKYKATREQLYMWYWDTRKEKRSLYDFIHYGWDEEIYYTKEQIKQYEERVNKSQNIFNKELEKYS